MNNALITSSDQTLSICVESGVLTPEAKQQISTAVQTAAQMPTVQRRMEQIDRILEVRSPSPVRQARAALADLQAIWDGAGEMFHKFRQQAFEMRLLQAKLTVKRKNPPQDPDEFVVFEAECDLEQARIDAMASALAAGKSKVEAVVSKAAYHANQYARIGQSMTADDFLKDDAAYIVQSAFWHAARTFSLISPGVKGRSASQKWRDSVVRTPAEVRTFFQALQIPVSEVNDALKNLADQKRLYDMGYMQNEQVAPPFEYDVPWLQQQVIKHADRVLGLLKSNGPEWAARIQQMLNPNDAEKGTSNGMPEHWKQDRGVMFE